jgi:serine protease Do/serine protease DegQ
MIGIAGQAGMLTQTARHALHIESRTAVEVMDVARSGPAAEAGIRAGDVIYQIDGKPVANVDDMRRLLERLPDGARVRVGLVRTGATGPAATEVVVRVVVVSSRSR